MGVIAKGIPKGCQGLFTPVSLGYPLSVFNTNSTLTPPPPGGFPIYYVPSLKTVSKRNPLEEPGTNPSRGVLLHTGLDEGT